MNAVAQVLKQVISEDRGGDSTSLDALQSLVDDLQETSDKMPAESAEKLNQMLESMREEGGFNQAELAEVIHNMAGHQDEYRQIIASHAELPHWMQDLPLESLELFIKLLDGLDHKLQEESRRH